jgi:hypothetical protein
MKLTEHKLIASILAAGVVAWTVGAVAWAIAPTAVGRTEQANAAHTLRGTETGHLHLVKASGSTLYEEGPATGPLRGHMVARLYISATFSGSFSVYTREGSITGHGTASPRGSGRYKSFAGTLTLTGGTGRYAHARGQAGLYGTLDQRSDDLVIQTTGSLTY